MVLLASAFLLNRLRRAVLAILVDVRKVRDARDGLDPRQTPTHDQLV